MGCEYLASEYHRDRMSVEHVRDYCAYTLEACLVDDPLGYINCTRRTWLMLNQAPLEPPALEKKRAKRRVAPEQGKLC